MYPEILNKVCENDDMKIKCLRLIIILSTTIIKVILTFSLRFMITNHFCNYLMFIYPCNNALYFDSETQKIKICIPNTFSF